MGNKTFRLNDEDEELMGTLSSATGLGPVGVLRLALRELAKNWAKKEKTRKTSSGVYAKRKTPAAQ